MSIAEANPNIHIALQTPSARALRIANRALSAAARFWFTVTITSQLLFAFYIATFYGRTAARGEIDAWNRFIFRGHVAGAPLNNTVVALHLASAVVMILAGALQFIPAIRARFPVFHRWTGRTYALAAVTLSGGGLWMQLRPGAGGDLSQRAGLALNVLFVWLCAGFAIWSAMRRQFARHRQWAVRLFLVASGAWFFRVAFFLSLVVFRGPVGFDPNTFTGPFLTFLVFAQFLVPLAIAQLYFTAQRSGGATMRIAVAISLCVFAIGTAAGSAAIAGVRWMPAIRTALDSRKSIAIVVSQTIEAKGLDAAIERYRALKTSAAAQYNFESAELNRVGYQLLRRGNAAGAIRIFRLNIESFPRSSDAYDSLGEAYRTAGDRANAIASYRQAIALDPHNASSIAALKVLEKK